MTVVVPQREMDSVPKTVADAAASVLSPARDDAVSREDGWPVLYLFHGLGEDHSAWVRNTAIERISEETGIAVVMPSLERSFGLDMAQGPRWGAFLEHEVPAMAARFFRLTTRPERTFAGGASMGGYCAFRLALACPDRFSAAFSLSGALDFTAFLRMDDPEIQEEFARISPDADRFERSDSHLPNLLLRAASSGRVPRLYQSCGKDDFLYGMNAAFRDEAGKLGVRVTWRETPGDHEWRLWEAELARAAEWLAAGMKD